MIVPHQASAALKIIMKKLGFKEGTYIDNVHKYGNMVSSSVPFAFCEAIEDGVIKRVSVSCAPSEYVTCLL